MPAPPPASRTGVGGYVRAVDAEEGPVDQSGRADVREDRAGEAVDRTVASQRLKEWNAVRHKRTSRGELPATSIRSAR